MLGTFHMTLTEVAEEKLLDSVEAACVAARRAMVVGAYHRVLGDTDSVSRPCGENR